MKEKVRMMKKKDANAPETKKAVEEMMALQKMVKELKLKFGDDEKKKLPTCDKDALDALLQRRMFVVPSFDIYGGVKGLYVLSLSLSLSLFHTHTHIHTHTTTTITTTTTTTDTISDLPLARSRQTCFTCGEIISFWRRVCWRWSVRT